MRFVCMAAVLSLSAFAIGGCAGSAGTQTASAEPPKTVELDPATVKRVNGVYQHSQKYTQEEFAAAEAAGDPIVCQAEGDSTTRVKRYKVCKPQSEWDARAETDRAAIEEARRYNVNTVGTGGQ